MSPSATAPFATNFGDEFVHQEPRASCVPSRLVTFRRLSDGDPFPFGYYKRIGATMKDVPARVLDRWRDAKWMSSYPAVADYIERNATAIDAELEDEDRSDERQW